MRIVIVRWRVEDGFQCRVIPNRKELAKGKMGTGILNLKNSLKTLNCKNFGLRSMTRMEVHADKIT